MAEILLEWLLSICVRVLMLDLADLTDPATLRRLISLGMIQIYVLLQVTTLFADSVYFRRGVD